jgi:hypothetical protein
MVKDELQQRGFVVRGKISGNTLSLIMFSNAPRTNEMDKILKSYSEDHQSETPDTGSRSSTPERKKVSSVPNSPTVVKRKSSIPIRKGTNVLTSKKTRSSSIPTLTKKADIFPRDLSQSQPKQVESKKSTPDLMSRLGGQQRSSSAELLSPTRSVQFKVLAEHSLLPLLSSQPIQSSPQPSHPTKPPYPTATAESQLQTQLPNSPDLNMEFILNKLKQANRKK